MCQRIYIFFQMKLNYFCRYSQFSLWILIALTKTFFSRVVVKVARKYSEVVDTEITRDAQKVWAVAKERTVHEGTKTNLT